MKNQTDPDANLILKSSACEIRREGDEVSVQLGNTVLLFDIAEFAAFAGSCRRATSKIYGNETPRRVLRRGIRDLQLVVDNAVPEPS